MTQQTGALAKILIGLESAFKTIATEGFVMPISSCSVKGSKNQIIPATITGNLNPVEPLDGNVSVAGQIVVPVDSLVFWYWLRLALGDPVTTGSSSPWTHTFKAGNTRSSFTLEYQYTELDLNRYFQYTGCKISGMSLSAGDDGELIASFDVVGAVETIATSSFDLSPTTLTMARMKNSQLTMTEGGSTISNAKLADLNINFNLDTSNYVIGGGGVLGSLPDGIYSVSGNLNALFEDTTLLEKALDSTESAVVLTFTVSASAILVLTFPEIKYTPSSPGVDGPQGMLISLPFAGYYDNNSDATSFMAALTNTEEHA
jgi:hypothetical protein